MLRGGSDAGRLSWSGPPRCLLLLSAFPLGALDLGPCPEALWLLFCWPRRAMWPTCQQRVPERCHPATVCGWSPPRHLLRWPLGTPTSHHPWDKWRRRGGGGGGREWPLEPTDLRPHPAPTSPLSCGNRPRPAPGACAPVCSPSSQIRSQIRSPVGPGLTCPSGSASLAPQCPGSPSLSSAALQLLVEGSGGGGGRRLHEVGLGPPLPLPGASPGLPALGGN